MKRRTHAEVTAHFDGQLSVYGLILKTFKLSATQRRELEAFRTAVEMLRKDHTERPPTMKLDQYGVAVLDDGLCSYCGHPKNSSTCQQSHP